MVHNFDPFLWQISGEFGIRWYGLSYMAGFLCAYMLISWMSARRRSPLPLQHVADFITYSAIGILVGGRLGYCVFYDPSLFLKFKSELPFWGVLAVNEGGMASHGGMIGVVVAAYLFSRRFNVSRLHLFDLISLTGPIGIFFGRLANFVNGELLGRPAPANYPWAIKFPQDMYNWFSEDPAKIAELKNVVDKIGISQDQWLEWVQKMQMDYNAKQSILGAMNTIITEIQNGRTDLQAAVAGLLVDRYPSQLYAALGEGLFVFIVLFIFWRKPRKPGVVGALFVVLYAMARVVTEQFRLPDAHIGYQWLELTRGQWLSLVMFVIGLFLMFFWGRRATLPISGWAQGENIKLRK